METMSICAKNKKARLLESCNTLLQKKCIIRILRDIGIILIFSIYGIVRSMYAKNWDFLWE